VLKGDLRGAGPDTEVWTAGSDIGRTYGGRVLTAADYFAEEDRYIAAVRGFLAESEVNELEVVGLEWHSDRKMVPLERVRWQPGQPCPVREGQTLDLAGIEEVSRLCLREALWCKLERAARFFVHFGYDFAMYVGSDRPCAEALARAQASGLFVEAMRSPYLDEPDE
jgi:hypothetical protein